jgi:DNA replication protein DnaC
VIPRDEAEQSALNYLLLRDIAAESVIQKIDSFGDNRIHKPSVAAVTSSELAATVAGQFANVGHQRPLWDHDSKDTARREIDFMRTCSILFLDDLGKAKNTPTVAAALFAIIDHRHAENLCTIWTANSKPEDIVVGMSEDMAGPLAGRLIECSNIITA